MTKTSDPQTAPSQTSAFEQPDNGSGIDGLRLTLLGLALLAFALRIFLLDAQSIWWDEGISLHLAGSNLAEILGDRLDNIHPPLYFILLKAWLALTGESLFSARYLSLLASWLQVAAAYAVAARWFGRRTGMIAAFLAAISAVSIIYAQEVRVYSMLPLAFLALLAITRELTHSNPAAAGKEWITWFALGAVSWFAVHLHYVSLFAVGYVTAWALLSFLRARRWPDFRRVLLVQFLAALASLPWFVAAIANWTAISGEANAGTFVADAVPLRFLAAQVWTFHLIGLAGALSRPGIGFAAGSTALLLLLLISIRLYDRRTRRPTAVLLANWLIPLTSALLVWLIRSFSHPRYVAMFVPGLILLAAYVILPNVSGTKSGVFDAVTRALSLLLFVALAGLSLWGLSLYFFDDDVAKDDIRGAARTLKQMTGAGDLILVPDTDWSLPFEYQGDAQIAMPGLESGDDYWENLAELTAGLIYSEPVAGRVFTLDYERGTRDWQGILPFALHKAGTQSAEIELDDLLLRVYELDQPLSAPEYESLSQQFGPLELSGAWIEQGAPAGDALSVALQWRMKAGQKQPGAHVALRLLDQNGRVLTVEDDRLVDSAGRPSDQWPAASPAPVEEEPVSTYHLLPVPPATPPLDYMIAVEVYEAESGQIRPFDLLDEQGAPIGQTYLIPGVQTARGKKPPVQGAVVLPNSSLGDDVDLAPGLVLQGVSFPQKNTAAGSALVVDLLWQAAAKLPDLRPQLLLVQDEAILASNNSAPSGGRYPTTLWEVGEQVLEERVLTVPAGSEGQAQLLLMLGEQRVNLGDVAIEAQEYNFERPQMAYELDEQFEDKARLAGFDLAGSAYATTETVPITLLWESVSAGSPGDFVVFAHLLSEEGRLIGQHDGPPAQGKRPLSGWVAGEYILDTHELVFRDTAYEGMATIEVGLYDPVSGERVLLQDGSDSFLLPVELAIMAP